jgi:hypothetical protein
MSTGFSFGSASSSTTAPAPAASSGFSFGSSTSSTSSPFAFGSAAKPAESTSSADSTPAPEASTSTEPVPAPEASTSESSSSTTNQTPGGNPFAAPGAGEEGETIFHHVRGRVFKLKDGAQDLGIATISLKEREEDGKKKFRVLARNEVNGAVLMVSLFILNAIIASIC